MKQDPLVGTTLAGRYRIDALLGEGGMGKVYAGEHVLMRKRLAIKVLHRELTTVPEVVARFEREAMAAANIDHSNIAAATDFGKLDDGSVYLVLEYVEGLSLRDLIAIGPMDPVRAIKIARQTASALGAAHALDIVHRDLKPENVMLVVRADEADIVKVLDFGIAKVPLGEPVTADGKVITRAGMVFGTPEYMAPEQALGQPVDGRADLYSLGVILFEMLAGRRPFSSSTGVGILGQQLSRPVPTIAERAPGVSVPPALEQVVLKTMARDLGDRYQKAADLVATLDGLLGVVTSPGPRLFTQLSGSPTAVLGSYAGLASRPGRAQESAQPLPPRESIRPGLGAGFSSYPDGSLSENGSQNGPLPDATVARSDNGHAAQGAPALGNQATWPAPANPDYVASGGFGALGVAQGSTGVERVPAGPLSAQGSGWRERGRHWVVVGRAKAIAGRDRARLWAQRSAPQIRRWLVELRAATEHTLRTSIEWIDARRGAWPKPLRRIPARVYLGVAGMTVFGLLVGLMLLVAPGGSTSGVNAAGSASAKAQGSASAIPAPNVPQAELDRAKGGGSAALLELSKKYPSRADLLLELAKAYLVEKRPDQAVGAAQRALSRDPRLNQNGDLLRILWQTAQPAESMEATFSLLEGPMGAKGADVIYDLVTTPGVRKEVKKRGEEFFKSDRFGEQASPALKLALALKSATYCQKAYELLPEAKEKGDERTLRQLRRYEPTAGCGRRGRKDCYPCMHRDGRLRETMVAIERRTKTTDAKPAK